MALTTYVALLRAINVGGTGKLPMVELRALCGACGFVDVETYIQSGNVVFRSGLPIEKATAALAAAVAQKMGKPHGVLLRTAKQMAAIAAANPFSDAQPNQVLVVFLPGKPPTGAIHDVVAPGGEKLVLLGSELWVHFPDGMGSSKLKVPMLSSGTGRNLNSVRKVAEMAGRISSS